MEHGTIFGFYSSLSAPLNRKLEQITEKALVKAINQISSIDKDFLYYIEPTLSDGRYMYAKSPFRKVSVKKRISSDLPKTLNMMPFAFADGNEGDNSSDSEDEAKP